MSAMNASNSWSATMHSSSANVTIGMAVTLGADGTSMMPATTANLTASPSGVIEGIAVTGAGPRQKVILFRDGRLTPGQAPSVGVGNSTDFAVVNGSGVLVRSSALSPLVVGVCGKDGSVTLDFTLASISGIVGVGSGTFAGIAAATGNAGDVLVTSGHAIDFTRVIVGTPANLRVGVLPVGVALLSYVNLGVVVYAGFGATVPAAIIGLGPGEACYGVVNASGRVVRKQAPDGGDVIIGEINTQGNLVVLPFRPMTSAVCLGQGPFYAANDGTADCSAAITAAIAAANLTGIQLNFSGKRVLIPPGHWRLDKPVHVKYPGILIEGDHIYSSHVRTVSGFAGPSFYFAQSNIGEFPHQSGQFGTPPNDNALIVKHEVAVQDEHWLDLREYGAGLELGGLAAFTIEIILQLDVTNTNQISPIVAGYGERETGAAVAQAMGLNFAGSAAFPNTNCYMFSLRTSAGTAILQTPTNSATPGVGYHCIEFSWDGTTIRGFIDGVLQTLTVHTGSASLGGTIVQQDWEWVALGGMLRDWGGWRLVSTADFHLASLRLSNVARHTSSYANPTTKYGEDANTLFLLNGDRYEDLFVIARSRGQKGVSTLFDTYIPHRHDNVLQHVLPNVGIKNMSITNLFGCAADFNSTPNSYALWLSILAKQGVRMFNNCYKSFVETIYANGFQGRCGFLMANAANSMSLRNIYPSGFDSDVVLTGAGDVEFSGSTYTTSANTHIWCANSFNVNVAGNPTFSDEGTTLSGRSLFAFLFFRQTDIVSMTGVQWSQAETNSPLIYVQSDGLFGRHTSTYRSCYLGARGASNGMIAINGALNGHIAIENCQFPTAASGPFLTSGSPSGSRVIVKPEAECESITVALSGTTHTLSRDLYLKNRRIEFTGTLAAGCLVTVPSAKVGERWWRNSTLGGFDVTLVAAGGSLISVVLAPTTRAITIGGADLLRGND